MEQRLTLLTLGVRDLATARRFYVEGLGWEPELDLDSVVFIPLGHGLVLSLFGDDDLEADIAGAVPARATPPAPARFTLARNYASTTEVDHALERFVAAGGTVLKAARRADWGGYHGYVADPDGFRWELAYNPGLGFDEDGRVRMGPVPT